MTIRLYSFAKRQNSTKQPLLADLVTTLNGELKTDCSVLSPVVIIEVPSGVDLFTDAINYAYIPDLGRRYWVVDIILKADKLAELHLSVDVLGSYKTPIGNSTQYVYRAASLKNGYITDNTYPITNNVVVNTDDISIELPWTMTNPGDITEGYYVIGVINGDANAIGCVSYYVFDQTGFADIRNKLMSNVNYTGMTFSEIEQPLYKSLYNPFQYISSVMWFPMKPPSAVPTSLYIDFGFFHLTPLASHVWLLDDSTVTYTSGSLNTFNHPQLSEGYYYNCAPFTQRRISMQPFGDIDLDCSKLLDVNHVIKLRFWVDFITGLSTLRVFENTTGDVLGGSAGQLGVPLNISQVTQSAFALAVGGMAGSINTSADNFLNSIPSGRQPQFGQRVLDFVSNTFDKWADKTISAIGNAALTPTILTKGTNGSLLNCVVPPIYETKCFLTTSPDYARYGAPLCTTKTINTLSGFIQCTNARFELAGLYDAEISAIESYMNAGFFYE